jgi:hypothetical protein
VPRPQGGQVRYLNGMVVANEKMKNEKSQMENGKSDFRTTGHP